MSLTDKINEDLKHAMKSGDKARLMTVRSIRAALLDLQKRGTGSVEPEEELQALLAAAKKRKEAIEMYEKGGREDLAAAEREELNIIQTYLPQQLSEEEAITIVDRIIQETGAEGAKDFGKVMPLVMKELKGKMDGKIVQALVKTRVGG